MLGAPEAGIEQVTFAAAPVLSLMNFAAPLGIAAQLFEVEVSV